jgi:hypothetical protein
VTVRAIRGATQLDVDEAGHLLERTAELMQEVLKRNDLSSADVISIFLTGTPDLRSAFPAAAVRAIGITDTHLAASLTSVGRKVSPVPMPAERRRMESDHRRYSRRDLLRSVRGEGEF